MILGQQLILKSHASTAYLEERKEKIFLKEENPITLKRKIEVLLEKGMDVTMTMKMKMKKQAG